MMPLQRRGYMQLIAAGDAAAGLIEREHRTDACDAAERGCLGNGRQQSRSVSELKPIARASMVVFPLARSTMYRSLSGPSTPEPGITPAPAPEDCELTPRAGIGETARSSPLQISKSAAAANMSSAAVMLILIAVDCTGEEGGPWLIVVSGGRGSHRWLTGQDQTKRGRAIGRIHFESTAVRARDGFRDK